MKDCRQCQYRNPRGTATALIIRDNKILVLKRNEEPYKDMWDLPGGYMQEGETPNLTLKRELKEELNIDANLKRFGWVPGLAPFEETTVPILSLVFLVDFEGEIKLNDENSEYTWIPLSEFDPKKIAFDSNQRLLELVKKMFTFDLFRVAELLKQLDSSFTELNEQAFYKSMISGHIETVYDGSKLVGMGWIYPRQTALRHQAVVEDLIVDEAYRGQGLGAKIMLALHDWAKLKGVEVIELTTNPKRVRANELYKELGYKLHETNHYLFKL